MSGNYPQKSVRFAKTVRFVDDERLSSSPDSSTGTLDAPLGWPAPPAHPSLPGAALPSIPAPVKADMHGGILFPAVTLDKLLTFSRDGQQPPPLFWDLEDDPSAASVTLGPSRRVSQLTQEDLVCPAALCGMSPSGPLALRELVLVVPGLPLEMVVRPAGRPSWAPTPLPYATVGDVLYTLYRALHLQIHVESLKLLDTGTKQRAAYARDKRDGRGGHDSNNVNFSTTLHWIDCLGDSRAFLGLRPAVGMDVPAGGASLAVFSVVVDPL